MRYLTIYAAVISTWLTFRAIYGWFRYRLMLRRSMGTVDVAIGDAFRELFTGVAGEEPYTATLTSETAVTEPAPPPS